MPLYSLFLEPFFHSETMRLALLAIIYQSLAITPIGLFLVMRRMSLIGDALSHSVLPGVALGYVFYGMDPVMLSIFGFATGFLMMLGSTLATRYTRIKEDANFAGFYLSFLAFGVVIVSLFGQSDELVHLLFGSLSQINRESLLIIAVIATVTLVLLALIYRILFIDSVEPNFLKEVQANSFFWILVFQTLIVLNLIGGFQTMGTLLPVGLMMIPAITAKFWFKSMGGLLLGSFAFGLTSGVVGLVMAYHLKIDSGAIIILCSGIFYLLSLLLSPKEGLFSRFYARISS